MQRHFVALQRKMATLSTKLSKTVEVQLEFEGILSTSLRPKLISDIIKLILYQRQQIPVTYRDLKTEVASLLQVNKTSAGSRIPAENQNEASRLSKTDKLKVDFLKSMDMLSDSLQEAFQTFHPIQEVIIVFGATLFSPNEVYRLSLPTDVIDGKILSERHCLAVLLRNLVGSDIFENVKETKTISKWTLLFLAPRLSNFGDKFVPKLTFKPPVKGIQFKLDFSCHGRVINPNISKTDDDLEMSGIEPLENSTVMDDIEMETDLPKSEQQVNQTEDLIWYEVKPSIKGFKM